MSIKNKYNRQPKEPPKPRGNRDVIKHLLEAEDTGIQETVNTEIQEPVNTGIQEPVNTGIQESVNAGTQEPVNSGIQEHVKVGTQESEIQKPVNTAGRKVKKATFDLDADLHRRLKSVAVLENKTMVEIVEDALKAYLDK